MVHACSVSIAPLNVDSVPTNGLDLGGSNAGVQGLAFQGTLARHLIHTGGTRALETQVEVGEGELLSCIKTEKDPGFVRGADFGEIGHADGLP
jgi:hypothetical protein